MDRAIEHAGKAVELSPDDWAYRLALASCCVVDMRWDEAKQALDTEEGRGTAVYRLLTDAEALVLPEGAVYLRWSSAQFGVMLMGSGQIPNLPQLRLIVYAVPMTFDEVETFYAGIWDGFELLGGPPEGTSGVQYLRFVEGGLAPLEPGVTSEELEEASYANDGFSFMVLENPNPDGEGPVVTAAGDSLPDTFRATCCYLWFTNLR